MDNVLAFARPAEIAKPRIECVKCGATTEAACDCGATYRPPTAGERAARALAEHPEQSDRAIAEIAGVSDMTVGRARKAAKSTATDVAVRTGRDGKTRKQPTRSVTPTEDPAALAATNKLFTKLGDLMMTFGEQFARWHAVHGSNREACRQLAQGIDAAITSLRELRRQCRSTRREK